MVLEELLRAWESEELQLVLLAPEDSRMHSVAKAVGFEWHKLPIRRNGNYMRDILKAVKTAVAGIEKCDKVVGWTIRTYPAVEWLAAKWQVPSMGVLHDNPFPKKILGPVLWDLRGLDFRNMSAWADMLWCSGEFVFRMGWQWQWAHRVANRFSMLICVSEAVRKDCIRKGYECEMTVIRNGLADIPVPERAPSERLRIGFLGMSMPGAKGFPIVEKWIKELGDKAEWKLYGNASARSLRRVERLKAYADVECCGQCPREEIFENIDILVHATPGFDSLPTVLIEAARAGIPCVASSNGGAWEIVREDASGFVFNPAHPDEGLVALKKLDHADLRSRMGNDARKHFEDNFRVGRMVRNYRGSFLSSLRVNAWIEN